MISDANSGGVFSRTDLTVAATAESGSANASVTSAEVTVMVRGRPATVSRPRTSIVKDSCSGRALPIAILSSSEVCSPIIRLYLRRT